MREEVLRRSDVGNQLRNDIQIPDKLPDFRVRGLSAQDHELQDGNLAKVRSQRLSHQKNHQTDPIRTKTLDLRLKRL